jgi:predicted dehydrogenase
MASSEAQTPPVGRGALRVGIVGTGNVARRNYIPVLAGEPGVSLGYVNRTPAKADSVAGEFGGQAFDSIGDLMAWRPDTVFVLTSEQDRLAAASALLDLRPRRLFFEKPLVARDGQAHVCEDDFVDARDLLGRAAASRCETAMIFNYRFFDQSLLARRLIRERELGPLTGVTGLVHYACWSHCIDLVHYFAGPLAEVVAVRSRESRSGGSMDARDISAAFRTVGDAVGTLIGTAGLPWEFPLFELTLSFGRGRIHLRGLDGDLELLDEKDGRHETFAVSRGHSRWDHYDASFRKSILAYLDSVRREEPPPVPGLAGLQELQTEAGIRRSIAQGRPVSLEAEFPLGPSDGH